MYTEDGRFIFDKENCEDCRHWVEAWDYEMDEKKMLKGYGNNYKNQETQDWHYRDYQMFFHPDRRLMKDPIKEREFKRRTRSNWHYNESKYAREKIQKKFKMKMKTKMINEEYHLPTPHEYKTYGWETH